MRQKIDRRWYWIAFGVIIILLRVLLGNFPTFVEQYYSRGVFPVVRYVNDYTISLLPVPLLYVLIFGAATVLIYRLIRAFKTPKSKLQHLGSFLLSLLATASGLVAIFLLLWGFNYARIPLEEQIGLDIQPLSAREIQTELENLTQELVAARAAIPAISAAELDRKLNNPAIEPRIRTEIKTTLKALNYPTPGRVRARLLRPKGVLLRISTAGFYFPFVGECHVDAGLHAWQIPFVMAHEFSHGYGITDEGTCNFLAYLACDASEDPYFRYSGILSYWRYLAGEVRHYFPEEYKAFFATLPESIVQDLKDIRENMRKYPDIFPQARNIAYNTYLKTQGIEEGMKNYSRVVVLATAWRKQNGK